MRICQFALIGTENVGDEAIFETIYRDLQTLEPEQHTILSTNPGRTRQTIFGERTMVLSSRSVLDTIRAIGACDLFVCGGGGLFQDYTSVYNPIRYLAPIETAYRMGKFVYVYAVSIGPLTKRLNRESTGRVLSRAACITVRDDASRGELISMGVPGTVIHVTSDPVLNFVPTLMPQPMPTAWRKVIVCLRHWFDSTQWLPVSVVHALQLRSRDNSLRYQRFINELARILDHLANYPETTLMFVPFCGERDNQVHRDVVAKMKHADRTKILQAASPQETQRMIAEADFIFGMRLHSLIMAAAAYRPFFAIDYLTKVSDFLESLLPGTAHAVSVSPVDLSADVVIGKLENLRVTDYFGANYVSAVARLKSRERENVKLLHTTFGSSCFSAGAID